MMRYYVDSPANVQLLQIEIDRGLGLRDAAGNPTPQEQIVVRGDRRGPASQMLGPGHQCYDRPGAGTRVLLGADGSAALELVTGERIDRAIPTGTRSLLVVSRARDHAPLPAGVRDILDDEYVRGVFARNASEAAAAAEVSAEIGARAAAALARRVVTDPITPR